MFGCYKRFFLNIWTRTEKVLLIVIIVKKSKTVRFCEKVAYSPGWEKTRYFYMLGQTPFSRKITDDQVDKALTPQIKVSETLLHYY